MSETSGPPERPGGRETLRASIGADFRNSSWRLRFALIGVVAWLVYEWGPGNETVTPWLVVRTIGRNEGPMVIVAAALVGFGFTFLQQLASGTTALLGFSLFERTASAAWHRLSDDGRKEIPDWTTIGWVPRTALVFGLGTTAVALVQVVTSGEVGVRRHLKVIAQSALLLGLVVGAVAAFGGTLAWVGSEVPAWSGTTDGILRVLGNPLVWLTLAAVLFVLERRNRRQVVTVPASAAVDPDRPSRDGR
jgi:hypothetical protein